MADERDGARGLAEGQTPGEHGARLEALARRFGPSDVDARHEGDDLCVEVAAAGLPDLCSFLRDAPDFLCDYPADLFATDTGEAIVLRYRLHSTALGHVLRIRVALPRDAADVPSVTHIWPGMNWHERECYDLFGVHFRGHPDVPCPGHMRILLPEDWEGHPFRKDYVPMFAGDPLHGPQETN